MDYLIIKEDDLFLLTDKKGNIPANHPYGLGLYTKDTRFLSKFDIRINQQEPVLLSSSADENYLAKILLTNPHIEQNGEVSLWRESVEIERMRFIYNGTLYETIKVKNFFPKQIQFELSIQFDADFKDMFIIRGFQNGKVGKCYPKKIDTNSLTFYYEGSDHLWRSTNISWDRKAKHVTECGEVTFEFQLNHGQEDTVTIFIQPQVGNDPVKKIVDKNEALIFLMNSYKSWQEETTKVETDYLPLQKLVDRGILDLRVLLTDVGYGKFPVAGLPWYGVLFGRDSLIAAWQMLAFNPKIAKGTLLTLANNQGKKIDQWRDEQPGKIMHEIRYGELATTNQIPFNPYYGTVDATPLFLILLVEYVKWTGDLEIMSELENHIEAALSWIDQYGDRDGDLFVEYHQESSRGIANQGWKDSSDSIVHRNGDFARSPIALSEVQGYVYYAKTGLAEIFDTLNKTEKAKKLYDEASELKERFEKVFWMEDVHYYAIALDESKEKVGTITSNPGHLLFTGMLENERANAVVDMLISSKMFSGYGIRTMGKGEAGYNPISYHNGSVWPHDNSIILLGMSKVGRNDAISKVISGLIHAASQFENDRLPELFCGYDAEIGKVIKYPVACSPQAWAAGTPLVFIQVMLGLSPNSLTKEIRIHPNLLPEMNHLTVKNIAINQGYLSLNIKRNKDRYDIDILENSTGCRLIIDQD